MIGVTVGAMSPFRPNVIRAMDFQFEITADGRTLGTSNVIRRVDLRSPLDQRRPLRSTPTVLFMFLDRLALQHGALDRRALRERP